MISAARPFATLFAGIPDVVAMRMTGHKTRSVFDRYDIVSEGDLTDAGHKLNDIHGDNFRDNRPDSRGAPAGPSR